MQAYGSTYGVYGAPRATAFTVRGGTYGVRGDGATGYSGQALPAPAYTDIRRIRTKPPCMEPAACTACKVTVAALPACGAISGYVGVWGEGPDWGFFSIATRTTGQNYGIMSECKSSAGFAGYFKGNVHVTGTLTKAGGAFRIDHPLDPERKWLQHSFVESPDMMNVYNGNVTTDSSGLATVKLPAYFGALNRDFRYQLTVIGTFAQAIVDSEIQNNQFRIRTSKGRVKVSWQVTGIRQDDYAKAHPIVVEVAKKGSEAGARQFVPKGSSARRMMSARRAARRTARQPASVPPAPKAGPPPREPPLP